MDLKQIEYFLAVAKTRNFSEASEQMGLSQPALSKAIQRLEDELGLLIYRDGKDTRLTRLARKLLGEFEAISKSAERARLIARSHCSTTASELRIGLSTSFGPTTFERFFLSFMQAKPDVRISTFEVSNHDGCKAVLSGELDAMIGFEMKENPKITCVPLFRERALLALSKRHRLAEQAVIRMQDLRGERFIDRRECVTREGFLERARAEGVDLANQVSCHREDWVQRLVSEGHGVTVLEASSLANEDLVLRPVEGLDLDRGVCLHTIFGSCKPRVISCFEDFAAVFDWNDRANLQCETVGVSTSSRR